MLSANNIVSKYRKREGGLIRNKTDPKCYSNY